MQVARETYRNYGHAVEVESAQWENYTDSRYEWVIQCSFKGQPDIRHYIYRWKTI